MTPLPPPLGTGELRFWRLDAQRHAATWQSGEGSFRVGGRWNSSGVRTIYASLDPATAVLEVAVHKGFNVLDTQPHILICGRINDPALITVVTPDDIPNPNWLTPGTPNTNQQLYGDELLKEHRFVLIPSAVSRHSWNLIFNADKTVTDYDDVWQERFALDPRLQP
uniref:RES family NAD+ phosphorylase n=1 Tax=Pararhizobium sp. IMCC3301 TaxID=3067904 RepID=UPI002740742E|nr:RES domain-containing protein [Pararhizobium sp. IMCC3301]